MEEKPQHPVDRGWAWVIVFGYFVSIFCMVGIAKSFGILMEEFVAYFNIPMALAALIMGVSGGVYTLAAPVCIAAGQHFTQRRVVMLGGLVGGLGLTLSGLLLSIEWVILTFGAMYGFGNACIFGNGFVILGQYFNKRRSLANGLGLSGASIGQFALPPLLQYLLDRYSLKGTLIIIGGMYFNVIMCGLLFRPTSFYTKQNMDKNKGAESEQLLERDHEHEVRNETQKLAANGDSTTGNHSQEAVRYRTASTGNVVFGSVDSLHTVAIEAGNQSKDQTVDGEDEKEAKRKNKCIHFIGTLLDFTVLKSYIVVLLVIVSFLLFFGHFNFILFMPAAASSRGVSSYDKAFLVSITGICDLCGRILVGVVGDLQVIERYKILSLSTLCCGASIFVFNLARQYWLMAVCVGVYGFVGGCYVAINAPVIIDMVGMKSMPKVFGVVLFIQGIGAAFGQPLLGAMRDAAGSFDVIQYICSFMMVAGSSLLLLYPATKRMEQRKNAMTGEPMEQITIS